MNNIFSIIQTIYNLLGVDITPNTGDVLGILTVCILIFLSLLVYFKRENLDKLSNLSTDKIEKTPDQEKIDEPQPAIVTVPWRLRLKNGFARSRQEIWGKLEDIFSGDSLDDEILDDVEEILYGADIGTKTVEELISELKAKIKDDNFDQSQFKLFLYQFLKDKFQDTQLEIDHTLFDFNSLGGKTKVIMIVGVNGAGKTTTIGKLATKLTDQGAKVVVGACDTFRAAAVDQLAVWCDRAGAEMVRAKEGSNPSGVGYQALELALAKKADYCILDTAGRLHTKGNLMDELVKSKNVLNKLDENAPHHVLLVIDAITGQNALRQAEEFNKALNLTGIVLTKCDGSSKAGSAIGIVKELNVPIYYIGVGEDVADLNEFKVEEYLQTLLGMENGPCNLA